MVSIPDSASGGQKRSLTELLAGRTKRFGKNSNSVALREAALYLLCCNQDVGQFLSEVEAPPSKKSCIPENPDLVKSLQLSSHFVGLALKDQASHLQIPAGILTAKAAVANIQQICQSSIDKTSRAVLNQEQRDNLRCLQKTLKDLLGENCFCRSLFSKELWNQKEPPVMEAIWHLHKDGIVCLEEILERLSAFEIPRYRTHIILESIEQFFIHTLTRALTFKPKLKVSDAIRCQGNWSFVKASPLLTDLYRKLFIVLGAEKLSAQMHLVLDTQEVNWYHVLTFVSCLVVFLPEAQQHIKDLIGTLLSNAFNNYALEGLTTAFLIARQAALEGSAAFVPYAEWFKYTFGAASSYHSGSKKSLVFLLKFLSDIVPFEAPQYLKVHILHPPFVPTKYRPLLMEYISLAKTRLADMKVSIEDMGLYEDLTAGPDSTEPQSRAQQDVEKAVRIFENTGKIPASVMEASIFRRPYFTSRFLPALLAPRLLPAAPDALMLFIDSLKRADKIPANMFSAYLEACDQEKHRKQEGRENLDQSIHLEPLERLQSALQDLRPLIADPNRFNELSAQLAVVSEKLNGVMGNHKMENDHDFPEQLFPEPGEELEIQEQTVADLLLSCFCQCIMAASGTNPPDRQGPWPSLYLKTLSKHPKAISSVLSKNLQLLCNQALLLKDSHVVGLAAFCIHLHECQASLPFHNKGVHVLERYWENLLNPLCSDSMAVCLKFCISATCYALCRFSLLSNASFQHCIPSLFLQKFQYLLPRLVWETRREIIESEKDNLPLTWSSFPLGGWKEAAVSLWSQSHLQELLRTQSSQLCFRRWLLLEMAINPNKDILSDTERQDYQRWAINDHYLPEASAAGGCDGNLERACITIVDGVLEFCNRQNLHLKREHDDFLKLNNHTGLCDILCRLQELVCDLVTWSQTSICSHFPFQVFYQRLAAHEANKELSDNLIKQGQLEMCSRILLGLPPLLLVTIRYDRGTCMLSSKDFFQFVNKHLKNIGPRGCALPYNITAHFFRGVVSASARCEDPSEAVNSILVESYALCPILIVSAALWWPQLDPMLNSQWSYLHGVALPKELEIMKEQQTSIDNFLSQGEKLPTHGPAWLTAAFLNFTIERKKIAHRQILEVLCRLNSTE
ncbi:hypothetical protein GDO86_008311, partial [Hymenochirus boettgeri]